ncbi:hypothetical protein [Granulibacter bethesdensis]|uniref:hypothetical protein n=1 Tax=Granulibacter bethesdensis TaxID=364410 RepID=UPI00046D5C31|nr:hypothetical protein [Granulibacter bethesdensis]
MARIATAMRRNVTLALNGAASTQAMQDRVAAYARDRLAELRRDGHPEPYRTYVDGREGVPLEQVRIGGGTIAFLFSYLAEATSWAVDQMRKRSPVLTGAYRDAWIIAVNGVPLRGSVADIPPDAEVIIVNTQPYHRKIDMGAQITRTPPRIVESVRQSVLRRYPNLLAERRFVTLGGVGLENYVLKGRAMKSGLTWDRKGGFLRLHAPRPTNRRDSRAGELLTYPALVMAERRG